MAQPKAKTKTKARARRRPPQKSWLARNVLWVAVAAVVVLVGVIWVLASGGDDATTPAANAPTGLTGADFHSLIVDPSNPQRLFVGGHTAVSVSTDGGRTWNEVASLRNADAMGWAFVADAVYVSGHPGLNRSTDGGFTFERVNQGLPNTDVHSFGGSSNVLYGGSPAVGVFASTAGVGKWEPRTATAGQAFFGRIVVDPANDQHLFAADAQAGVMESTDGGRSWRTVSSGLPAATWMSRGGEGLAILVASGPAGAARSTDGGRTWQRLTLPVGATLVEAVPGDPLLLYAGRLDGSRVHVLRSSDGGVSWAAP